MKINCQLWVARQWFTMISIGKWWFTFCNTLRSSKVHNPTTSNLFILFARLVVTTADADEIDNVVNVRVKYCTNHHLENDKYSYQKTKELDMGKPQDESQLTHARYLW